MATLRLELSHNRVATTEKLRKEWERRKDTNVRAVVVLMNNLHLWSHVDGPAPETELLDPSEVTLLAAKDCCSALAHLADEHGDNRNELAVYVSEITEAVSSIQLLSWESIRTDRFSLTPPELYYGIVANAQAHLERRDEEAARRRARLAEMPEAVPEVEAEVGEAVSATQEDERQDDDGYTRIYTEDSFGLDIDKEFKGFTAEDGSVRGVRKPANWQRAVHLASEVLVAEMRTLLEIHYDHVHLLEWRRKHDESLKKMPKRKSEWAVFRSVVDSHRRKPCMRVELSSSILQVLRCPTDELIWEKLEAVRGAVAAELQDETVRFLTVDELSKLAKALEGSASRILPDQLTEAFMGLPAGSRAVVAPHVALPEKPTRAEVKAARKEVLKCVHKLPDSTAVRFLRRPFDGEDSVGGFEIDPVACDVCRHGTARRTAKQIAEDKGLTKQDLLDRMLLCLYDALFLRMAQVWSNSAGVLGAKSVANLHVCETYALAKWWLAGMNVGSSAPIFDGICSQCACLLYGTHYEESATSNKCSRLMEEIFCSFFLPKQR